MIGHDQSHTYRSPFYGPRHPEIKAVIQISIFSGAAQEPIVGADGTLYLSGRINGIPGVFAYEASANAKWNVVLDGDPGVPALAADGSVLVATDRGTMYSLTPDGDIKWAAHLVRSNWPIYFTAVVTTCTNTALLLLGVQGTQRASLFELNAIDGSIVWRNDFGAIGMPTPIVAPDGTLYVGDISSFGPDKTQLWSAWRSDDAESIDANGQLIDMSGARSAAGTWLWRFPIGRYGWANVGTSIAGDGSIRFATRLELVATGNDGSRRWGFEPQWPTYNLWRMSPAALSIDDTAFVVAAGGSPSDNGPYASRVISISAAGIENWRVDLPNSCFPVATVIGTGGMLYVSCGSSVFVLSD